MTLPVECGGLGSSAQEADTHRASAQDRVIRDGKVAVLVSGGFGAGWFSWNGNQQALLFDPELVAAVEAGDNGRIVKRAEEIDPDGYYGGADGLGIRWVEQGKVFRIDEYDGNESLIENGDDSWVTA